MGSDLQFALEGTLSLEAEILSLDGGQLGELGVDVRKVKLGNSLVQDLGEDIDANLEFLGLTELDVFLAKGGILALEQQDLCKDLVGEGAGHDERRVSSGTSQVDETTLGKENDVAAALHEITVDLGLDVLDALGVLLQPGDVNLDIEVTNV